MSLSADAPGPDAAQAHCLQRSAFVRSGGAA